MSKRSYLLMLAVLMAGSFLAGYRYHRQPDAVKASAGGRRVLYYVDPMNPAFRSDKPGIAPCGMQLEPVYAGGAGSGTPGTQGALPAGAILVPPGREQLIGVRVAAVEKSPLDEAVRLLGRVVPDETRIYRINSAIDGWVKKTLPFTTGSLVRKNDLLASYYAPEFLSAIQAYLYAVGALDRFQATGKETREQIALTYANIENYKNTLRNLGMCEQQIEEIHRTRELTENIEIRSPATGFLITRNVSLGQRFEKGTELYRIADLGHVWILADVYENEAQRFRPGQRAQVRYQGRVLTATVSNVPPQFDPASRTMKVRLEADNPAYILRPDMFVDVELSVSAPPVVNVPAEAILDSGLRKIVFVDRGNGLFEPRPVETGRHAGERVEIVRGLVPGERIVVSGNFLLDSESRMRTAATTAGKVAESIDPVCGMTVDQGKARAAGLTGTYRGKTYYFCSAECRKKFNAAPQRYAGKPEAEGELRHGMDSSGQHRHD